LDTPPPLNLCIHTDCEETDDQEQASLSAGPRQLHDLKPVGHTQAFHRAVRLLHQTQLAGRLRSGELQADGRGPASDLRGVQCLAAPRQGQLQRPTDRRSRVFRGTLDAHRQPPDEAQSRQNIGLIMYFSACKQCAAPLTVTMCGPSCNFKVV